MTMRFAFPKKRKKTLPYLPILTVFTGLMMIATVFGEGGIIHALSMRVVKEQALLAVEGQHVENKRLATMIRKVQSSPAETQKFLAAYAHLSADTVTVYNFKTVEDLSALEQLEQLGELTWWERIEFRTQILMTNFLSE